MLVNSTNLTQQQTIYFKVKVKVQGFTELSHSRLSSCGITSIWEALEMGNNPSASGSPGDVFVTTAQLNGRQAPAAGMGNSTVRLT